MPIAAAIVGLTLAMVRIGRLHNKRCIARQSVAVMMVRYDYRQQHNHTAKEHDIPYESLASVHNGSKDIKKNQEISIEYHAMFNIYPVIDGL